MGDTDCGVSVAWHKVPYIKGGWAQWDAVGGEDSVTHFNQIRQGSSVNGNRSSPRFFILGDQISSLPGWQEGAIASAWGALKRPQGEIVPEVSQVPSSLALVEGIAAVGGQVAACIICPDQLTEQQEIKITV